MQASEHPVTDGPILWPLVFSRPTGLSWRHVTTDIKVVETVDRLHSCFSEPLTAAGKCSLLATALFAGTSATVAAEGEGGGGVLSRTPTHIFQTGPGIWIGDLLHASIKSYSCFVSVFIGFLFRCHGALSLWVLFGLWVNNVPVPKLSSPQREQRPESIRFPKYLQPVGVSYSASFMALATLRPYTEKQS